MKPNVSTPLRYKSNNSTSLRIKHSRKSALKNNGTGIVKKKKEMISKHILKRMSSQAYSQQSGLVMQRQDKNNTDYEADFDPSFLAVNSMSTPSERNTPDSESDLTFACESAMLPSSRNVEMSPFRSFSSQRSASPMQSMSDTFFSQDGDNPDENSECSMPEFKVMKQKNTPKVDKIEENLDSQPAKNNTFVYLSPTKKIAILVLHHPASLKFEGSVCIQVISGTVTILGSEITYTSEKFVPIFSSKKLYYLQIETKSPINVWREGISRNVKERLESLTSRKVAKLAIKASRSVGVIVALRKNTSSIAIDFAISYIPYIFSNCFGDNENNRTLKQYGFTISDDDEEDDAIIMTPENYSLAEEIITRISNAKHYDNDIPRIVITGPKGVGKSTLLRFIINRVLNVFSEVCYLDGDPGQAEFTPAGCLSLTKITEPLLGPPFTHQKTPEKAFFIGGVSVQSPEDYSSKIYQLAHLYNEKFNTEPLFVNTMGFLTGVGAACLENLISYVQPTILIELVKERDDKINDTASYNDSGTLVYKIAGRPQRKIKIDAPTRRNLSILSYFGKCQSSFERMQQLLCFKPYCIDWTNVVLHVVDENLPLDILLLSLNSSLVALCFVDEKDITVNPNELDIRPRALDENALTECLGFGVVRSIDYEKRLLHVITPLPLKVMSKVNTLIKGNVNLPKEVFLKQNRIGVHIPFVRQKMGQNDS